MLAHLSIQTLNTEGEVLSSDTTVNTYGFFLTSFTDIHGQLYFIIQLGNPYDTATIHIGNFSIPPSERSGQYLIRYSPEKSFSLVKKIPATFVGVYNKYHNSIVVPHFFYSQQMINGVQVDGLVMIRYNYEEEK